MNLKTPPSAEIHIEVFAMKNQDTFLQAGNLYLEIFANKNQETFCKRVIPFY